MAYCVDSGLVMHMIQIVAVQQNSGLNANNWRLVVLADLFVVDFVVLAQKSWLFRKKGDSKC